MDELQKSWVIILQIAIDVTRGCCIYVLLNALHIKCLFMNTMPFGKNGIADKIIYIFKFLSNFKTML